MIKGSIFQEHIIILNEYELNNNASKYMSKNRLEGEIDKSTIIVGDFGAPLFIINRSIRQK